MDPESSAVLLGSVFGFHGGVGTLDTYAIHFMSAVIRVVGSQGKQSSCSRLSDELNEGHPIQLCRWPGDRGQGNSNSAHVLLAKLCPLL